ncbi:TMV resistance protein N-like isoform X1 [Solanum tuberosum]|uniref:TMV resistance protein N-like isoform X1 n=1 Tax=Solanum tuberosum TaxID=4113 RepID=UPI00073A1429|nr:PREDICTED: TMV resistance protein N-like isoform X1 [Solanum tuberosum]
MLTRITVLKLCYVETENSEILGSHGLSSKKRDGGPGDFIIFQALVGAGWRTFKDDNETERGENIKTELENAIINSRSSIIIISKNYATSTWCLDELVKILEHKRTKGHAVLPVFYHVDPSEVRDQKKSFAEAFASYERQIKAESDEGKRELIDKVRKWRAALGEVADSGGVLVNNQEYKKESEFIEEILQLIEDKLNRTISSVAPYLVGISSQVENIISWLQDGSHDDNVIAICGMSGIGKTTVAKYVFTTNCRRFEGSSFLENIQDISQQPDGLIRLQKQLLYDLTGKKSKIQDTDEGIIKIRDAICSRRVLVILDDIDQQEQIHAIIGMKNWFCPGSKIIITTKNSCLLKVQEIQKVHKVREMGNDESLELFSWHSFGEDHPADDYMELSKRVVKHCGGLPLALQVLGSSLRGKNIDVWKSALDKLETIPASQIIKKLKFGYDSLKDDHDKNLFLDIACFFARKDKDYVIAVLEESYIYTRIGIQNLIDRFLLMIEGNKLIMHQMLRDMGREIVRQESPKKPGRRTRLWHYKDSFNVLRENVGSDTIEGLFFDMNMVKEDQSFMGSSSSGRKWLFTEVKSYRFGFSRHPNKFSSKTLNELELGTNLFTIMNKLRLLQINYTHLNGAYKDFPKNLRWLYWRGFPLKCVPNDFPLESLSVLDMRNSCLERLWEGRRVLPLVKILNLSHSHSLFRTPDFSGLPMLEKLALKECVNLIEVHESIGTLDARLIFLNIKNCKRLQKLPREICKLKVLKTFIISGCSNLVELPRDLWRMQSLEVFLANEIPMSQLPSKRKQNPIWHALIRSWVPKPKKVLELSWVCLPKSLVKLSLSECNLSEVAFPRDFSNLMSLQNLDLSKNPISCLPDCIRTLSRLNNLELGSCTMLKFLIDLPRIHNLSVGDCTSLERVTYLSVGCRAKVYHINGCKELTDMEGSYKLESMGGVEKTMKSLELSMWDSVGSFEVKLYNNSTHTESRGPVKVLFESGMISMYLPGSMVPDWFCYKSAGSTLSFTVPSSPDLKIQGITVCSVYTIDWKVLIKGAEFYLIIHNKQKNVKLIYSPTCYGLPEGQNEMLWFTHWKFLSQLDAGDTLNVTVFTMVGFIIKEIGIHLMHGEQVDMIFNSNSQEMQRDYPYQGVMPMKRQGLVDLYCYGYMGAGLDYILPYIP